MPDFLFIVFLLFLHPAELSHLFKSVNKIVGIEKKNPDNKNNYCNNIFVPQDRGQFIVISETDFHPAKI